MLKFDQRSKKVITFSGKKSIKSTNSWEVLKLDGKYKFEIKKNNALFSDIKKSLSKEQLIKFKKLIGKFCLINTYFKPVFVQRIT